MDQVVACQKRPQRALRQSSGANLAVERGDRCLLPERCRSLSCVSAESELRSPVTLAPSLGPWMSSTVSSVSADSELRSPGEVEREPILKNFSGVLPRASPTPDRVKHIGWLSLRSLTISPVIGSQVTPVHAHTEVAVSQPASVGSEMEGLVDPPFAVQFLACMTRSLAFAKQLAVSVLISHATPA
jgi:hypothetical protein